MGTGLDVARTLQNCSENYMKDFTLKIYSELLAALQMAGYETKSISDFVSAQQSAGQYTVILRHDVDKSPGNALKMAKIEHDAGINGTYYFRTVKESFDPDIIRAINGMGHETAYHYEDLSVCNGDFEKAIQSFQTNLERIKCICPVSTISMHGSPWSKYDNRDLWQRYDYKKYGIKAEAYLDIDYTSILYLTDSGRTWADIKANLRDRVQSDIQVPVRTTVDIINMLRTKKLPETIIITLHPQRWHNNRILWISEWCIQKIKNLIKPILIKWR